METIRREARGIASSTLHSVAATIPYGSSAVAVGESVIGGILGLAASSRIGDTRTILDVQKREWLRDRQRYPDGASWTCYRFVLFPKPGDSETSNDEEVVLTLWRFALSSTSTFALSDPRRRRGGESA